MTEPDPYADDPFFRRVFDGRWNACIGRQGEEEHYLDGYIEAAIELVDAIIEKKLFAKRDMLVLPILYNARHAMELALKFATDRLVECSVLNNSGIRRDHDIGTYWNRLHEADIGDEKLRTVIAGLKPFVESMSRIDADGQELRYHRNRNNEPSLSEYSVANLMLIQNSLRDLKELLRDLKHRSVDFVNELATDACTKRCSRSDLLEIAHMIPLHKNWSTQAFKDQKEKVKARFQLSNRDFSDALKVIKDNREMSAIIGIESSLLHITDDELIWVVEQWRRIHPRRPELDNGDEDLGMVWSFGEFTEYENNISKIYNDIINEINERLSSDAIADLEAIFYIARDNIFSEYYLQNVKMKQADYANIGDLNEKIRHLLEKTNLLMCLQKGARMLGRLALAQRLMAI